MICIFPGQGSQFVGMGKDIYNNFSVARNVFHEVDEILNKNLSKLIFEGPLEELTLTENAQPALMTVSIATLRAIEFVFGKSIKFLDFKYVAGHSVGEYTALCAANAISLSDITKLLKTRGASMHKSFPEGSGGMVALLGGEISEVERVVKCAAQYGVCEIANDNSIGQVVVSGVNEALDELTNLIKGTSIKKAIRLQVSGPFHSKLMYPAYKTVKEFIKGVSISEPVVPLVSNLVAKEVSYTKIKEVLVKQIISRVRWREMILYMIEKGCHNFFEIGCGDVLSNLIKRINNKVNAISINSAKHIDNFVNNFADLNLEACV